MQIVMKLEPAIVVLDWAFHPALDVCRNLKLSFVLTVPIDLIHLLSMLQPSLRIFWMYRAFCSGFPFPLPRHLVMASTYLLVRLIIAFLSSSRLRIMARSKKAAGLGENLVMTPWRADEEYICPSLPELESHQCSYLAMSRLVVQSCLSSSCWWKRSRISEMAAKTTY